MTNNTSKKVSKKKQLTPVTQKISSTTPPSTPKRKPDGIDANVSPLKKLNLNYIFKKFESSREWVLSKVHIKVWKVTEMDGNVFIYLNTGKQIICTKVNQKPDVEPNQVYLLENIIRRKNSIVFTDRTKFVKEDKIEIKDVETKGCCGRIILKTQFFDDSINVLLQENGTLIFSVNKKFDIFEMNKHYQISFLKEATGKTFRVAQSSIIEEIEPIKVSDVIITTQLNKVMNNDLGFYITKAVISNVIYSRDYFRNSIKIQISDENSTIETGLYNDYIPKVLKIHDDFENMEFDDFRDFVQNIIGKDAYFLIKKSANKKKEQEKPKPKEKNFIYYLHNIIYTYEETELVQSFYSQN